MDFFRKRERVKEKEGERGENLESKNSILEDNRDIIDNNNILSNGNVGYNPEYDNPNQSAYNEITQPNQLPQPTQPNQPMYPAVPRQVRLINPHNRFASIFPVVDDLLEFGEHLGIERKNIGNSIVKSISTGKFNFAGLQDKVERKNGFQKAMQSLKSDGIPVAVTGLIVWIAYRWVTHVWIP